MRMDTCRRITRVAPWTFLVVLAACAQGNDEMSWARTALERNADIEIIAEDAEARTFTVRNRKSGALEVVQLDQIAASSPAAPASATTPSEPTAPIERAASAAPADPATSASTAQPDESAQPVDENDPAARAGDEVMEPVAANGQVIASGKGYSIERSTQPARSSTPEEQAPSGASVERRNEPLVCQGARFLRIDGRTISFEGDAIKAEEGCELHITNSRISANGVGLAARNANVHITNSAVSGQGGAIDASGNTQIYARSSRFSGMVRKLDGAVVHDQGDNVWN